MRFFVYESVSAGVDPTLPASLRREGAAMLRAIVADLARIAGADVRPMSIHRDAEEPAFRGLARWADYSLVIAPEIDNLLYNRCRWVEEENGLLLGPSASAVALTSDKKALAEHLLARGVRTPECLALASPPS